MKDYTKKKLRIKAETKGESSFKAGSEKYEVLFAWRTIYIFTCRADQNLILEAGHGIFAQKFLANRTAFRGLFPVEL